MKNIKAIWYIGFILCITFSYALNGETLDQEMKQVKQQLDTLNNYRKIGHIADFMNILPTLDGKLTQIQQIASSISDTDFKQIAQKKPWYLKNNETKTSFNSRITKALSFSNQIINAYMDPSKRVFPTVMQNVIDKNFIPFTQQIIVVPSMQYH